MRMTYDPVADAMYLDLTERDPEGAKVAHTVEVAPGLMLDLTAMAG